MSQVEMSVRRFEPGDAEDVWRLHISALDHVGARGPEGVWEEDLRNIEEVYITSGGEFLVARIGSQLAAMGALKPVDDEVAELKRVRVDPALQRRGLGRRILYELETRAVALGFLSIVLDTATVQVAAQRLYEAAGYLRCGDGVSHGYEVIHFKKRLVSVVR
ncbi:GNAT family N-acetyltransferase [Bradyrhizobium sp. Arg62]|nr:GNAT family N-acetyltransferase [Bradyrhizobium ivorense]MCC8951353.1 GNAT family N-acetyltransferase [Bradyrhizobium brasilense]